jgi:Tfp pilus assembly protein PilN
MRKFELDFQRRPAPSVAGWLLLVAGIGAAAALGHQGWQVDQHHTVQAARMARLHAGNAALDAGQQKDDPQLVAARQMTEKSKLPWDTLFGALESTDQADVALLAIVPEVQRRNVKIHAEARDFAAMLAFQRHLQLNTGLSQVVLLDHTVNKDVAEKPVRFHIQAHWGTSNVSP